MRWCAPDPAPGRRQTWRWGQQAVGPVQLAVVGNHHPVSTRDKSIKKTERKNKMMRQLKNKNIIET
jgi:hypothetical protein